MSLPKIEQPLFDCLLPSVNQNAKFRPMLVKEEKILLMAKQASERSDYFNAIKQVVTNCTVQSPVPVDKMAYIDVAFLFTKIRAQSVGHIAKVSFLDNEDEKRYDFEVDLNKVTTTPPKRANRFTLGGDLAMTLKFPPMSLYTDKEFFDVDEAGMFERLMLACLDRIYDGDKVHICADASTEELKSFIDSLPAKVYNELQEFFSGIPSLFYEIKYKNSKGTERTIVLQTIDDFFMFG